jgi:hypothetical protein
MLVIFSGFPYVDGEKLIDDNVARLSRVTE